MPAGAAGLTTGDGSGGTTVITVNGGQLDVSGVSINGTVGAAPLPNHGRVRPRLTPAQERRVLAHNRPFRRELDESSLQGLPAATRGTLRARSAPKGILAEAERYYLPMDRLSRKSSGSPWGNVEPAGRAYNAVYPHHDYAAQTGKPGAASSTLPKFGKVTPDLRQANATSARDTDLTPKAPQTAQAGGSLLSAAVVGAVLLAVLGG